MNPETLMSLVNAAKAGDQETLDQYLEQIRNQYKRDLLGHQAYTAFTTMHAFCLEYMEMRMHDHFADGIPLPGVTLS